MEADLLKLLVDYVLAGVFIILYVRSQDKLASTHEKISEQRREENREMRTLLFELTRRGVRDPAEDTGTFRAFKSPPDKAG